LDGGNLIGLHLGGQFCVVFYGNYERVRSGRSFIMLHDGRQMFLPGLRAFVFWQVTRSWVLKHKERSTH